MKLTLSIVCTLLLALFAYQVMSYSLGVELHQESKLDEEFAKSIDYELPQLAVLKSVNEYSEIIQRPLFVKNREAAIGARTINNVTTVSELSHLILVGTASSSDVQVAIVADTKAKQMERLKTGESYRQWEIAGVAPDHVVFQNSELEYKLFVTPIKGSQKAKQVKLFSQLNKSKIERVTAADKSYNDNGSEGNPVERVQPKEITGKIWSYDKKPRSKNVNKETNVNNKSVKKSPIKIPAIDEKSVVYYEGEEALTNNKDIDSVDEISAEDFYEDGDITEDELDVLEKLGIQIFDD